MKKIFTIAALFLLSAGMFAQDVNKATVEGQAAAAQNGFRVKVDCKDKKFTAAVEF